MFHSDRDVKKTPEVVIQRLDDNFSGVTHLSHFFKRVAYRKGRQAAVSATARKLAVIVWNMITKERVYDVFSG